jgi:hypothetical protein
MTRPDNTKVFSTFVFVLFASQTFHRVGHCGFHRLKTDRQQRDEQGGQAGQRE